MLVGYICYLVFVTILFIFSHVAGYRAYVNHICEYSDYDSFKNRLSIRVTKGTILDAYQGCFVTDSSNLVIPLTEYGIDKLSETIEYCYYMLNKHKVTNETYKIFSAQSKHNGEFEIDARDTQGCIWRLEYKGDNLYHIYEVVTQ